MIVLPILPSDHHNGPNCGVTAVAVLAGVPFDLAWETVRRLDPKRSPRWRGTTWWYEQRAALRHLGAKVEELPHKGMTLAKFADQHTVKGAAYLVNVTSHCMALIDGVLVDQRGPMPVAEHPARRQRVKYSARVTPPVGGPPNHD
ncbi:MAG: hypothetical protein J0I48_15040 [Devosia sp.]|uniref:hypothetical protein n=1 Tax=Devosia sp. 66-22 TaxID=1895753 RepID=UPI000A907802|nr:hypothetical protein [Devosia sp. 66-22]MBN9347488.1 hypothetical protein [Devosia sp.]